MNSFYNEIIRYFEAYSNKDKIIALTLREIFLNDLIYVSYTNKWQQYDIVRKEWSHFNIEKLILKLDKVCSFYENKLIKFVETHSEFEPNQLIIQIHDVIKYMKTGLKTSDFSKKCQEYFKICS